MILQFEDVRLVVWGERTITVAADFLKGAVHAKRAFFVGVYSIFVAASALAYCLVGGDADGVIVEVCNVPVPDELAVSRECFGVYLICMGGGGVDDRLGVLYFVECLAKPESGNVGNCC